ncbi:hypothetical protein [Streptomyces pseudogriseolus]|uniref:hypothetical protein n=1 Tax=Streptomyces pseudogriseolus TaxID=36817 RepID=UPI003FA1D42F
MPKPTPPSSRPCRRFNADGTACNTLTPRLDGWCGQCDGFIEAEPSLTRHSSGGKKSSRFQRKWEHCAIPDDLDFTALHLTGVALDTYAARHRCTIRQATIELKSMIEDLVLNDETKAWRSEDGMLRSLSNSGYKLIFSGDWTTLVGYTTSHLERTWAQVRAGVRSRISKADDKRQVAGPAWFYAREANAGSPVRISYAAAGLFVHTSKGGKLKRTNVDEHLPEIVERVKEAVARWDGTEGRYFLEDAHENPMAWILVKEPGRAPVVVSMAFQQGAPVIAA